MVVSTPCTQQCRLDETGARCIGCARTLEEIQSWLDLTEPQRLAIMRDLPVRRAATAAT